jgi:hypothetical protein
MRSLIKLSFLAMFVAALLAATGCEDTPVVAGENFSMTLDFAPPNPSFEDPDAQSIASVVSAVVLSAEGIPQQGISVLFSATGGTLDSHGDFRETDSHGVALDTVRVDRADAGAEIIVTARSGALTKTVTIPTELCAGNDPPTAQITPPAAQTLPAGTVNTSVSAGLLSGTSSTDPEGTTLTYAWTCQSGGPTITTSTVTCQYTYQATAKQYLVSLVVKDGGLPGATECALSSISAATVTINVPAGTPAP